MAVVKKEQDLMNSFIETRRHWFTKKVSHNTNGGVNVLNLDGRS